MPDANLIIGITADLTDFIGQMDTAKGAVLAVAAGVEVAAQASIAWQTELVQIQNNTGMTTAATQAMGATLQQLAVEGGASLASLGEGYMHLTNLQFSGAQATDVLTESMKSAQSTGGSTAVVANLLGQAMHEYGNQAYTATQAVDLIHLAGQNANSTFQEFAQSSARAIGIAANLGIPLQQVVAALDALTLHGYTASQAQTQLVNLMTKMIAPTHAQEAALAALSQASGIDLVAAFSATGLAANGVDGSLKLLNEAYLAMGYTQAQATAESMKLISAMRGGLGLATLMGTGQADFNRVLGLTNQVMAGTLTPTQDAWNRSLQTTGTQLDILKEKAQVAAIGIGGTLLDGFTALTKVFTDFSQASPIAVGAVAALTVALGALTMVALSAAASLVIATAPITVPLLAIGAAVGLLTWAWQGSRQAATDTGNSQAAAATKVQDAATKIAAAGAACAVAAETARTSVTATAATLGDSMATAASASVEGNARIVAALRSAAAASMDVTGTIQADAASIQTAVDACATNVTTAITQLADAYQGLDAASTKAIDSVTKDLGTLADTSVNQGAVSAEAIQAAGALLKNVPPQYTAMVAAIQADMDTLAAGGKVSAEKFNTDATAALQAFAHNADVDTAAAGQVVLDHVKDTATKLAETWINGLGSIAKATTDKSPFQSLLDAAKLVETDAPQGFEGMKAAIQRILDNTALSAGQKAQAIHDAITNGLAQLPSDAGQIAHLAAQNVIDALAGAQAPAATVGANTGDNYLNSVIDSATSGLPGLAQAVSDLLQTMGGDKVQAAAALLGEGVGTKFKAHLLAVVGDAELAMAASAQQIASAMNAKIAAGGMSDIDAQRAQKVADAQQKLADSFKATGEADIKQAVDTATAAGIITPVLDKVTAAHGRVAGAAGQSAAAQAKAAAAAAQAATVAADTMIGDLGKAMDTTIKSTDTIAQAFAKLLPILKEKLPEGFQWLQSGYSAMLAQIESATPPTLDQVAAQFQAWNDRILKSGTDQQKLLAQVNADTYAQMAAAAQAAATKAADAQAKTNAAAIQAQVTAAGAQLAEQDKVLGGLAGIVQTAADPKHNLGTLMSQTLDLLNAAQTAKMPGIVNLLQGYWDQMAAGQSVDLTAMNAQFSAAMDQIAATGGPKDQVIVQQYRDMWATVQADQAAAQAAQIAAAQAANSALVQALSGAGTASAGGTAGIAAQVTQGFDVAKAAAKAGMDALGAQITKDATAALAGVPGAFQQMIAAEMMALTTLAQSADPVIVAAAQTALATIQDAADKAGQALEAVYAKQVADAQAATAATTSAAQGLATSLGGIGTAVAAGTDTARQALIALGPLAKQAADAGMQPLADQITAMIQNGASLADILKLINSAEAQLAASGAPLAALLAQQAQGAIALAQATAAATAQLKALQATQTADQAVVTGLTAEITAQQKAVQALQAQYQAAQTALNNFKSAQLAGTQDLSNRTDANAQGQKGIQLAIDDLNAAGGDTSKARAQLQAQLAQLQAEHQANEASLAAQVGGATDPTQKANLQKALAAMQQSDQAAEGSLQQGLNALNTGDAQSALANLNAQLKQLQDQGAQMTDLGSLTFDPLKKAIDAASASVQTLDFSQIIKGITDSRDRMAQLSPAIADANARLVDLQAAEARAQAAVAAASAAVAAQQQTISTLGQTLQQTSTQGLAPLPGLFGQTAASIQSAWTTGLAPVPGVIATTLSDVTGAITGNTAPVLDAWSGSKGFTTQLLASLGGLDNYGITGSAKSFWPLARESFVTLFQTGIPEAIDTGMPDVIKQFQGYLFQMADETSAKSKPIGIDMMSGTVEGIVDGSQALQDAVAQAVKDAIKAGEQAADAHSPSQETRVRIGQALGAGATLGIADTQPAMEAAMARATVSTIQAGQNGARTRPLGGGTSAGGGGGAGRIDHLTIIGQMTGGRTQRWDVTNAEIAYAGRAAGVG